MNRIKVKAAIFTYIPIAFLLTTIICFVLASLLEQPTNRGDLYFVLSAVGIANMFIMPFPCLISSILGCIYSKMGLNEGEKTIPFLIISIIEIIFNILMIILILYMIFVIGPSV